MWREGWDDGSARLSEQNPIFPLTIYPKSCIIEQMVYNADGPPRGRTQTRHRKGTCGQPRRWSTGPCAPEGRAVGRLNPLAWGPLAQAIIRLRWRVASLATMVTSCLPCFATNSARVWPRSDSSLSPLPPATGALPVSWPPAGSSEVRSRWLRPCYRDPCIDRRRVNLMFLRNEPILG